MFCKKCGKKLGRKARYCSACGEMVSVENAIKKEYSPFLKELIRNMPFFIAPLFYLVWIYFRRSIIGLFSCGDRTVEDSFISVLLFAAFLGTLIYVASRKTHLFTLLYMLPYIINGTISMIRRPDFLFVCLCETVLPIYIVCAVIGAKTIFSKIKYQFISDIIFLIITKMLYKVFLILDITVQTRLAASSLKSFMKNPHIEISLVFIILCLAEYLLKRVKYVKNKTKEEKNNEIL